MVAVRLGQSIHSLANELRICNDAHIIFSCNAAYRHVSLSRQSYFANFFFLRNVPYNCRLSSANLYLTGTAGYSSLTHLDRG